MLNKAYQGFIVSLVILFVLAVTLPASAKEAQEAKETRKTQKTGKTDKACFTTEARALAERAAKVWQEPDPDYDPVLGHSVTLLYSWGRKSAN